MSNRYQSVKALMIDDDVDFLNLVRRILRTIDIELVATEDKESFLSQARLIKPHFYLVDLNLKDVGEGFSIIQELCNMGVTAPLFIVSAESGMDSVTHALEIGATDYFTKPLNRDVLEKKLSYYLKDIYSGSGRQYNVINGGPYSVQIEFGSTLDGVDEFGIKFKSQHLLPKGTLVKASGKIITEISGQEKILASVMSNGLDPATQLYVYYAEFEETSDACMNEIRKWLGSKVAKAA